MQVVTDADNLATNLEMIYFNFNIDCKMLIEYIYEGQTYYYTYQSETGEGRSISDISDYKIPQPKRYKIYFEEITLRYPENRVFSIKEHEGLSQHIELNYDPIIKLFFTEHSFFIEQNLNNDIKTATDEILKTNKKNVLDYRFFLKLDNKYYSVNPTDYYEIKQGDDLVKAKNELKNVEYKFEMIKVN